MNVRLKEANVSLNMELRTEREKAEEERNRRMKDAVEAEGIRALYEKLSAAHNRSDD